MAAQQGQLPFSDSEKIALLAEIIKRHAPSPEYLLPLANNIIGLQGPDWNNIILPQGRTVNQCAHALTELRRSSFAQPSPMMRQMPPQSTSPMSAGPVGVKRSYQHSFELSGPYPPAIGREIRPKLSSGSITSLGQQSGLEQPPKKKRGRPTKAEAQAKVEAQTASGDPGPALRPPPLEMSIIPIAMPPMTLPPEPPTSEPLPTRTDESQLPPPPPRPRMSVSSMLTPTGRNSASQSSSSSGKRRRGKSTRSEPEDLPRLGESSSTQVQDYESPYTRMGPEAQDSPARAAVLRHREEPLPDTRSPYTPAQETPSTTVPPTTEST